VFLFLSFSGRFYLIWVCFSFGKIIDMLLFDLGGSVSLAVDWLCMVITDMVLLDLSGSVLGGRF
jgi:hypothetical protein